MNSFGSFESVADLPPCDDYRAYIPISSEDEDNNSQGGKVRLTSILDETVFHRLLEATYTPARQAHQRTQLRLCERWHPLLLDLCSFEGLQVPEEDAGEESENIEFIVCKLVEKFRNLPSNNQKELARLSIQGHRNGTNLLDCPICCEEEHSSAEDSNSEEFEEY